MTILCSAFPSSWVFFFLLPVQKSAGPQVAGVDRGKRGARGETSNEAHTHARTCGERQGGRKERAREREWGKKGGAWGRVKQSLFTRISLLHQDGQ
jgi:hypothetical protein